MHVDERPRKITAVRPDIASVPIAQVRELIWKHWIPIIERWKLENLLQDVGRERDEIDALLDDAGMSTDDTIDYAALLDWICTYKDGIMRAGTVCSYSDEIRDLVLKYWNPIVERWKLINFLQEIGIERDEIDAFLLDASASTNDYMLNNFKINDARLKLHNSGLVGDGAHSRQVLQCWCLAFNPNQNSTESLVW